ncbi:hypothetical protein BH23ACT12_BH23ACT12_24460 [soil metagenome]
MASPPKGSFRYQRRHGNLNGIVVLVLLALLAGSCSSTRDDLPQESAAEQEEDFENPCDPNAPAEASELEGESAKEGAAAVNVTAVEFAFQGVQDEYPAGDYGFKLVNSGQQAHEMAVVRIQEGESRPVAEIMQLPEEEQEKVAEYLGGSVACPGKEAEALGLTLEQGRYSMICFIPVGLTPDIRKEGADKLGPPHFTVGMVKDFSVS